MPQFDYIALDNQGQRVTGRLQAPGQDDAVKELHSRFPTLVSLKQAVQVRKASKHGIAESFQAWLQKTKTAVPAKKVAFFTRQLATMFAAGMTLEKSVTTLGYHEKHKRFKSILDAVQKSIRSGTAFSDAVEKHPGAFGPLYVSLVRAGEISGKLAEILERLADHLENSEDTRRKVGSALIYPACVLFVLVSCVFVLLGFVAPKFSQVYTNFGAKLPAPTQILMNVGNWISHHFLAVIMFTVFSVVMAWISYLHPEGRRFWDKLSLRLPVIGTLLYEAVVARVARTFGLLVATSVPVLDAYQLVSRVAGNRVIEEALVAAQELTRSGRSMHDAFESQKVFPDLLLQLIDTGEETGELEKMFSKAADYYEKRVASLIDKLTSLIEPLLILTLGLIVGVLVILIYLPIFNLGSAMRKGL